MPWNFRRLVLLCALLGSLHSAHALSLAPCYLPRFSEPVECGKLEVPEDKSKPEGRKLTIHFARVPALSRPAEPDPVLVLAGGPGQGAMDYGPLLGTTFREARKRRDILLVDQRGTGRSAPLQCDVPQEVMGDASDIPQMQASLRICLAKLDADPRHYHLDAALPDFEAIRSALGYAKVNLWGGSYGTRTALLYAKRYPKSVRSLVLDSVAPPNYRILLSAHHAQAALDTLLADCAADQACHAAFPDLAASARRLFGAKAGATMPAGPLSRDSLAQVLRSTLYVPSQSSLVPLAIHAAATGRSFPASALHQTVRSWSADTMSLGQTLSVLCAEEAPFVSDAALDENGRNSFVGASYGRLWRAWCEAWPRAKVAADYHDPVASDAPALLFAGGLDPITPPATAELAARSLRHSRVLAAPKAGHTISGEGCAPRLIAQFLDRLDPQAIDGRCLNAIRRPPFVLADGNTSL